jgi:hypothetical protein
LCKPAIAQLSRNPERFQIHHHELKCDEIRYCVNRISITMCRTLL